MKLSALFIAALLSISSVAALRIAEVLIQKVAIATIKRTTTTATKRQKPSLRLGFDASWLLHICGGQLT